MNMGGTMGKTVAIGIQDFGDLIKKNLFDIDYVTASFWKDIEYEHG